MLQELIWQYILCGCRLKYIMKSFGMSLPLLSGEECWILSTFPHCLCIYLFGICSASSSSRRGVLCCSLIFALCSIVAPWGRFILIYLGSPPGPLLSGCSCRGSSFLRGCLSSRRLESFPPVSPIPSWGRQIADYCRFPWSSPANTFPPWKP